MSKAEQKERFHFLDGLRGIASLMIVVHHAFTANIARFIDRTHIPFSGRLFAETTQSGVDLFFVLSGVVLLRPYLRSKRQLKTGDYFYRRLKRIYPPYFFALLFGGLVIWVLNTYPTWYNEKGNKAVFSIAETIKEAFIVSFDAKFYNLAWWSLQIEVLFYILVPLIIVVFPTKKVIKIRDVVISIILTLGAALFLQIVFTTYCWRVYSYTYNAMILGKSVEYPVCFLLGIFLAARDFNKQQGQRFMIAGAITVITGMVLSSKSLLYMSILHSGYGLFYAGVITMAFNHEGFKHFLSTPIMIWFGERSYSIFLVHFSVFYLTDNFISHFTPDRNATYGFLTRAIGVPLALFCAMLLFHFVERRQAKGLMTDTKFWPWQVKGMVIE